MKIKRLVFLLLFFASSLLVCDLAAEEVNQLSKAKIERARQIMISGEVSPESTETTPVAIGWRMIQGLAATLAVLLIGVAGLKRFGAARPANSNDKIQIIERKMINSKMGLVLIEVEGERLLMTIGPNNVSIERLLTFSPDDVCKEQEHLKLVAP